MSVERGTGRSPDSTRRRAANACNRCRSHKIKCTGSNPCDACVRRNQNCVFGHRRPASQSYVLDLERRLAVAEGDRAGHNPESSRRSLETFTRSFEATGGVATPTSSVHGTESENHSQINPLALGQSMYISDTQGRAVYLGTSSNWSFGRRVLLLTYDRIMKAPLPKEELLWPDQVYELGWNGHRSFSATDNSALLPEPEHAMYLINAVKFYVGQLFHLFDDRTFMENLTLYQDPATTERMTSSIWYNHYLFILAFGKALTARGNSEGPPPGSDLFVQAISTLPDLDFADNTNTFEEMEILCCASLYLHSADLRKAAYKLIGRALRTALEQGLHADMQNRQISDHDLERARKIWWTVHLLDRHMTALQGLPLALRDQDISALLPDFGGSSTKVHALDLHIRLSKTMATVVNNIYGKEGRVNSTFLTHTKTALTDIAMITDELNNTFRIWGRSATGISRVSGHLHLLHHQCIVIATRPVLFNFLEARLAHENEAPRRRSPPKNIRALLTMCKESSLKMLSILLELKKQSLLESFLPFDLDAAYATAIVILVAAHIDRPLIDDHQSWIDQAYKIMTEMESHGNQIARILKSELEWIQSLLERLPQQRAQSTRTGQDTVTTTSDASPANESNGHSLYSNELSASMTNTFSQNSPFDGSGDSTLWPDSFSAGQIAAIAESLDLDGMNWWFDST